MFLELFYFSVVLVVYFASAVRGEWTLSAPNLDDLEWLTMTCNTDSNQYCTAIQGKQFVANAAIYYSFDYGKNWGISNAFRAEWQDLATNSSGQQVVAVGYNAQVSGTSYIIISTDFGYSWREMNIKSLNQGVESYFYSVASSASGEILYAVSNNGVAKSTNYGQNWDLVSNTAASGVVTSNGYNALFCSASGQYVYITFYNTAFYYSSDYGVTFTKTGLYEGSNTHIFGATSASGQMVVVCDNFASAEHGIYISHNYGVSWNISTHPAVPDDFACTSVAGSASGDVIVFGTESNYVLKTTDSGVTYEFMDSPYGTWSGVTIDNNGQNAFGILYGSGIYSDIESETTNPPVPTPLPLTFAPYAQPAWIRAASAPKTCWTSAALTETYTFAFATANCTENGVNSG